MSYEKQQQCRALCGAGCALLQSGTLILAIETDRFNDLSEEKRLGYVKSISCFIARYMMKNVHF